MPTPLVRYLIAEAKRLGIKNIEVDPTRKHYHLIGEVAGERLMQVVSRTPSGCSRVYKQARAQLRRDVRRTLGADILPKPRSLGTSKRRHIKAAGASTLSIPVQRELTRLDRDPWAPLRALLA